MYVGKSGLLITYIHYHFCHQSFLFELLLLTVNNEGTSMYGQNKVLWMSNNCERWKRASLDCKPIKRHIEYKNNMVVPATLAQVAGHALCGVAVSTTCEECQNCFNNIEEPNDNQNQLTTPNNNGATKTEEDSSRTLKAENIKPRPSALLASIRQDSRTLFAKPNLTEDPSTVSEEPDNDDTGGNKCKTTIHHQKDGELSVIEVKTSATLLKILLLFFYTINSFCSKLI